MSEKSKSICHLILTHLQTVPTPFYCCGTKPQRVCAGPWQLSNRIKENYLTNGGSSVERDSKCRLPDVPRWGTKDIILRETRNSINPTCPITITKEKTLQTQLRLSDKIYLPFINLKVLARFEGHPQNVCSRPSKVSLLGDSGVCLPPSNKDLY